MTVTVKLNDCPTCGLPLELISAGVFQLRKCAAGHHWHRCQAHRDRVVEGKPDAAEMGCTCVPGHTYRFELNKLNCLA